MLTSEFAHQAYYKAAEVIITIPIIAQNVTEVLPASLTLS